MHPFGCPACQSSSTPAVPGSTPNDRSRGRSRRLRLSSAKPGKLDSPVTDEAHDVIGDEPPDGAARVHADDDVTRGIEHEAGGLQVHRVWVGEGAGQGGDGGRVRAVADGNVSLFLAPISAAVSLSSTESPTTRMPVSASVALARSNARSCAGQNGHQAPRLNSTTAKWPANASGMVSACPPVVLTVS